MPVSVPGNVPANRWQVATPISFANRNEVWALFSFKAPAGPVGGTSQNIMQSHDNQSGGLRIYLNQSNILGLWRTTADNTNKTFGAFTAGQNCTIAIKISQTEGFITHWFNGSKVASDLAFSSAVSGDLLPLVQGVGVEGSDIDIFEAYVGFGGVPTDTQIQNHQIGDDLSVTMPGLTVIAGTTATGTNGSYASQLNNVTGSNHFIHEAGDLDNSASNQPTFYGESGALSLPTLTTTATTATVGFTSSVSAGTAYIVGDIVGAFTEQPSASEIATGKLSDGVTNALYSTSVNMTGQTEIDALILNVLANTNLDFYMVQDTDGIGTYSNILYVSGATKRPVVSPGTGFKWRSAGNTLLASETGMTLTVLTDDNIVDYTQAGLSTNADAEAEVNLTDYANSGAAIDIGDSISFDITRSNGEVLAVRNATIAEGT